MNLVQSLHHVAAEELLSVASLVLLLVCAWAGDKSFRLVAVIAGVALVGALLLTVPALCSAANGPTAGAFGGQVRDDAFAAFAKVLIYLSAIATLMVAPAYFERVRGMRAEFSLLVLLAALGMGLMVSAGNLLTLYVGLELNSFAAYILASFLRTDDRSAEAGLKYFVLGALASGFLLYGMSLIYGFTGSLGFTEIRTALSAPASTGAAFGVVLMLAGLAFKVSAAPFHMWTPDVYEGSPTPVTAFFATAPKVAGLGLLIRVAIEPFGGQHEAWSMIIATMALLSILVGAWGAIGQVNLKRLLAYSSINNVGFMLIGLATGTPAGISAMLVYLVIYVAMSLAAFVVLLLLRNEDGEQLETLDAVAGLSQTRPWLALALAAVMFSLAGIPPLFGFWGKFLVFKAAVAAGMVPLAAVGIAASVIGAFYYLKVVKVMYFDPAADRVKSTGDWAHTLILVVSSLVISPLGYLLTPWLGGMADTATWALFNFV